MFAVDLFFRLMILIIWSFRQETICLLLCLVIYAKLWISYMVSMFLKFICYPFIFPFPQFISCSQHGIAVVFLFCFPLPERVINNCVYLILTFHFFIFVVLYKENASLGKTTYVHCKAGRGRSTTIVLCYLVCIHSNLTC